MYFTKLLTLSLALIVAPQVSAQDAVDLNIPAQSLQSALDALAQQANLRLLYDPQAVTGLKTSGVSGHYTPQQAVEHLLEGTRMHYTFTAENAVAIKKQESSWSDADSASTHRGNRSPAVLDEMTVTAKSWNAGSYNVPSAMTATKLQTPIMESPVNIQVVPEAVMRDQQAIRVARVLENVSGVYRGSAGGDIAGDGFIIRGFETFQLYRNGVRFDHALTFGGPRETANLEQIEVLKGPASILYGRADPGGIINFATKKPLSSPYYALEQKFGSFDYYRTTTDATGPIGNNPDWLYRLNMAYETRGSFRDFSAGERIFVAPVVHWSISPRTEANLELEYVHNSDPFTYGFPVVGNRPAPLATNTNLAGPQATNIIADDLLVGLNWSHAFNDQWTLRHRFNGQFVTADSGINVQPDSLDANNRTLNRSLFTFKNADSEFYYTTLDLNGKFKTGAVQHDLLIGGDYYNFNNAYLMRFGPYTPIADMFNPVFVTAPINFDPALDFSFDTTTEWYGLYLQDHVQLPFNVHVLGGLRYDNATDYDNLINVETSSNDAVTPRVGLLWRPIPAFSIYGSYLENFGALSFGQTVDGSPLPPQGAQQWEVGVKTELFGGRLTGTLAYYDLTKQNVTTPARGNPLLVEPTGEVNHRGVELDIAGEPLPGWNFIAAYSYIDSQITVANDGTQGKRFPNVPRHGGSFWSTYTMQSGPLVGFKFGAGVVAQTTREGNAANDFQLPGFARFDLMASYPIKIGRSKLTLQLNVDNLTDKYYFGSAGFDRLRVNVATPRTILGSVRLEF